jgi:predicted phosphodiesterase
MALNPARRYSPDVIALVERYRELVARGESPAAAKVVAIAPHDPQNFEPPPTVTLPPYRKVDFPVTREHQQEIELEPALGPGFRVPDGERFISISDTHGDEIEPEPFKLMLDFCEEWSPKYRIHKGDWLDLRPLRDGAGKREREEGILADCEAGRDALERFRPTHLLNGNHDIRLDRHLGERGPEGDLYRQQYQENQDLFDSMRTTVFPWGKRVGVLKLHDLLFVHGYSGGEYACKKHVITYGSSVMFGHTHVPDEFLAAGWPAPKRGYNTGCLCKLDYDYNAGHLNTLRQGHGFGFGVLTPDGGHVAWIARIRQGVVLSAAA